MQTVSQFKVPLRFECIHTKSDTSATSETSAFVQYTDIR